MKNHSQKSIRLFFALVVICLVNFWACSDGEGFSASDLCPAEGTNRYGEANRGVFVDERDGRVYKYTTIGDQVWMAENLNHKAEFTTCYDGDESNCEVWGRLYFLADQVQTGTFDYDYLDSICPPGWHVPTLDEWKRMIKNVGKFEDEETAHRLYSTSLWKDASRNGDDECGLSIIPSGKAYGLDRGVELQSCAYFVTATMKLPAWLYEIEACFNIQIYASDDGMSIRCVKD